MEILPLKREDLPSSGEERCTFLFAKNRTSVFAKNSTFLIAKNCTLLFPVYSILTVNDVCDKLDLKRGTVYNLTYKQEIPHFKRGGRIYFDRGEVDDWIRRDRRKTLKQLQDEADIDSRKK